MRSEPSRLSDAFAVLGLPGAADPAVMTAAFRAAVKAARPDQPGGDEARFRRVIAAWRLIQQATPVRPALAAPILRPPAPPVVVITPLDALNGGAATVRWPTRTLRVRVPAGLRTGEHLRLKGGEADGGDLYLPVLIRGGDDLRALGDDLYMDWPVPTRTLEDGGRLEIDTHAGARSAWIVSGMAQPLRLCLKGLGLPARGSHPCGRLFVTLTPSEDAPSAAEDLLIRFSRVWTPDRLAA